MREEIENWMKKNEIDVLTIQETRIGSNTREIRKKYTWYFSGENQVQAGYEAGVAIVPGTAFGQTCQDYVRFSFAASRDNIQQALENIGKMLSK